MTSAPTNASARIAANARAIRARQQIKVDTLARRSGVSVRKVHRLLSGEQKWFAEDVEAIADGLGIDWSDLVAPVDERIPA